jgi:tryptophan 2,3-dioxygenase
MSHNLTYGGYLRVEELIQLQTPRSQGPHGAEHDELLFIIIHQVYELWFKELLHELDYACELLRAGDAARTGHTMRRILTILKTIVAQVDVLETMTPLGFDSFRSFLDSASGFQSAQFREIEFLLGHKRLNILKHFADDPPSYERLEARYAAPTLWDAFLSYLAQSGYAIPEEQLRRDVSAPIQASPAIQAILIAAYRANPTASNVCERLVDMDEGFQEWRYRHVKMVERTIGFKAGTGGSSGVQYLATTLRPLYPDLWEIRSQF